MITKEEKFRTEAVVKIAEKICLAVRTAPKACGIDLLEIAVASGDDILKLAMKMGEIGAREKRQSFFRDAENIKGAQAIVLIGTKNKAMKLDCSFCGWPTCADAEKAGSFCAYSTGVLGIAVGSAISVAADHRLDNRIMYTIGRAVLEMKLLGEDVVAAFGLPLSVSGKNPFFDRK